MSSLQDSKVTIHRGLEHPGRYVWSPFVTKLEFRFRQSNLRYVCGSGGPKQGPKGKMPYVELSVPSQPTETLADSALIIQAFISKGLLSDVNMGLSSKEAGQDLAIRAMLEDRLMHYNTHERWVQNYYPMRDFNLAQMPYPLRVLVGLMVYRATVQKLNDQGTGRFSNEEIHSFRKEIWEGVNGLLEDSRKRCRAGSDCFWVLGGKEPSEADATMYGFAVSCMVATAGPRSKDMVKTEFPVVVDYATRIHHRYFPDYEIWT